MLKKTIMAAGFAVVAMFAVGEANADQYVHGHFRSSGAYVQPHYRSNADGNFYNNWSTHPNLNPYTGRVGTHHYPTYQSPYQSPSYSGHNSSYNSYRPTYGATYWGR